MKFTITAKQLEDTEVSSLVMKMVLFGAESKPGPGEVTYWISDINSELAEQYIPTAIAKSIDIQELDLWVIVGDNITDNKVPSDWPDATFQDDEGNSITKRFDQYTIVRKGDNGESLLRIGHFPCKPDNINSFACVASRRTPTETTKFIDYLAGGDISKVVYGSLFNKWVAANITQETV